MEFNEFLYGVKTGTTDVPSSPGYSRTLSQGRFTYWASWKLFNNRRMIVGREEATSSGRAWAMHGVGRIDRNFRSSKKLRLHEIYAFADEAKKAISSNSPFRGPKNYKNEGLEYRSVCKGDLEHFESNEVVLFEGKPVFRINFQGGFGRENLIV